MPKEKVYASTEGAMFCPNCHRKVEMPFKNIKIAGTIRINCGNCKGGVVVIQGKKPEEIKNEE